MDLSYSFKSAVQKALGHQLIILRDNPDLEWCGKMMFTIEPNGDVKRFTDFVDEFVDAVRKLFGSDKK